MRKRLSLFKNPIVLLCYLCNMGTGLYISTYQITILKISNEFMIPSEQMGLLVSAQFIAMIVFPLLFGILLDRYGSKLVLVAAFLIFLTGNACVLFSGSISVFLLGIFACGAGYGSIQMASTATIGKFYAAETNKYINRSGMYYGLACVVGLFLGQWLLDQGISWRNLFGMVFVVNLLVAAGCFFCKFDASALQKKREGKAAFKHLINPVLLMFCAAATLYVGIESGALFLADAYFAELHYSSWYAATAVALFWCMMIPSKFIASNIKNGTNYFVIGELAIVMSLLVGIALARNGILIIVLFALLGFFMGPILPTIVANALTYQKRNVGIVTSMITVCNGLGGAIIPPVMSAASLAANLGYSYIVAALIGGLCCVLIVVVQRLRRKNIKYEP